MKWIEILSNEREIWIQILVIEEMNRTLRRSDMDKLVELAQVIPEGIVASQQPGLVHDRVGTVLRAFYASLISSVTSQFDRLVDSELRESTRRKTSLAIVAAYEKVCH